MKTQAIYYFIPTPPSKALLQQPFLCAQIARAENPRPAGGHKRCTPTQMGRPSFGRPAAPPPQVMPGGSFTEGACAEGARQRHQTPKCHQNAQTDSEGKTSRRDRSAQRWMKDPRLVTQNPDGRPTRATSVQRRVQDRRPKLSSLAPSVTCQERDLGARRSSLGCRRRSTAALTGDTNTGFAVGPRRAC